MRVTGDLVDRLEAVEADTDARLARALAARTADPTVEVHPFARGVLVATGPGHHLNRSVGITTMTLSPQDVAEVAAWYESRGLTPAVQLSSWAEPGTVAALAADGFVPTSSRSVLVRGMAPSEAPGDVVASGGTATGWLGAARTVPAARRRGVRAALVAHRVGLARSHGCDLVGATATTGSDGARNLQRLGFTLVQDQRVLERPTR